MEPWLAKLNAGHSQAAWDLFHERYRKLILATIRRLVTDHDEVMDVFSSICEALIADDFSRLRRYSESSAARASASTWLVVVVRNLTVDFLRKRDGRQRLNTPASLSPVQQQIYGLICGAGNSHVEAYEMLRTASGLSLTFGEFLREVRTTQRLAPCPDLLPRRRTVRDSSGGDAIAPLADPAESADAVRRLAAVLASQPDDVRLAVQMFIVEEMAAADVARLVGWPSAKTVYNRVSRALTLLKAGLQRDGIGPGDL